MNKIFDYESKYRGLIPLGITILLFAGCSNNPLNNNEYEYEYTLNEENLKKEIIVYDYSNEENIIINLQCKYFITIKNNFFENNKNYEIYYNKNEIQQFEYNLKSYLIIDNIIDNSINMIFYENVIIYSNNIEYEKYIGNKFFIGQKLEFLKY